MDKAYSRKLNEAGARYNLAERTEGGRHGMWGNGHRPALDAGVINEGKPGFNPGQLPRKRNGNEVRRCRWEKIRPMGVIGLMSLMGQICLIG